MDRRSNNTNTNGNKQHHQQNQRRSDNNNQPQQQQQQQQQQNRFRYNRNQSNRRNRSNQQQQNQHRQHHVKQSYSKESPSPSLAPPTLTSESNLAHATNDEDQQQQSTGDHATEAAFVQSELELEADDICDDVQEALARGMDSTFNMPLSEHVYYSSFESYDNIMIEQRKYLNETMSQLSECSDKQKFNYQNSSTFDNPLAAPNQFSNSRIDYASLDNSMDKYDAIHDFSEYMFDKIGTNLDDAEGLTIRNAQLIQATLEAANQNKLASQNKAQPNILASNLSSSSSSSSLSKPTEATNVHQQIPVSIEAHVNKQNHKHKQTSAQPKVVVNPVNSVVQSISQQQQQHHHQQTNKQRQYGGYLGKQQYGSSGIRYAQLENKNLPRPQNSFKDKIDNSYRPFQPLIKVKPNSLNPLKSDIKSDEFGNEYYSHPYEHEIQTFTIKEEFIIPREPIEPPELNATPITLVENIQQLKDMCKHIEAQKEFAVDVEHHSYRSFQGITCLLQISTRAKDFVIDAIKLRSELYRLNESFTNPNIVKVFHGADCDILWLQRDFGVYVVNLFDTSRAARSMKFAHLSLAFLLKHYCNVDPDKSYQLADWRERPLPLPMLQYAREDTHYLLYIYDRLKYDISLKGTNMGADLLRFVYERGREICLKRYEKPPFSETSHLSILRKSRSTFNAKQMFAFKELYAWRDSISRELDESVGFVLPNNLMIRIAEYLPREPQGITALCNPIPPTVKKFLSDIHAIILKALDVPLDETSKVIIGSHLNIDPSLRTIDLDSISHKQDIAHSAGLQESGIVNLLDRMHSLNCSDEGDQLEGDTSQKNHKNGKHSTQKNVNTHSRLYNFLDASWTRNDVHNKQNLN